MRIFSPSDSMKIYLILMSGSELAGHHRMGSRGKTFDSSQARIILNRNKKDPKFFNIEIYFRSKMYALMDHTMQHKIMLLQHRQDEKRLILTRSANGYSVYKHKTAQDLFTIKSKIKASFLEDKMIVVREPIFHEKGTNSGAIIEIDLHSIEADRE